MSSEHQLQQELPPRAVAHLEWPTFFACTVADNEGRAVVIQLIGERSAHELVRGKWLRSMVLEQRHGRQEIQLTYEHYAWDQPERLTHFVKNPTAVWMQARQDGTVAAVDIETPDAKVRIHFLDDEQAA